MDNARLRLNALVLHHPCEPSAHLLSRIGRHYLYQSSRAALQVAGDLDLLGSPASVLGNLGTGVFDFFYEPVRPRPSVLAPLLPLLTAAALPLQASAMVHNPKEIHKAVAKGTLSLVRSALLATGTATSKMSGTLSKGLAALSMDEEFIRRRAQRMAGSQRPRTISENLLDGARNLGLSVAEGASGLVVAPVVGARRDGVKGALVGVAQGVVGVAVKPAAGVLDLAARSAQVLERATARDAGGAPGTPATPAAASASGRARARPPRALGPDATLQVYDRSKAALREVLLRVEAGAYAGEALQAHVGLGAYALLCTEVRVLFVRAGTWEQSWQVPWSRVRGLALRPDSSVVDVQLFAEKEVLSTSYFFGAPTRAVQCDNGAAMRLVYATLQECRASYAEALVTGALAGSAAARSLRGVVGAL